MRKPLHQPETRDFLLFSQHTKNKRTLLDTLSHCCSRPTDAPRALFVYVLPPLSLFLYLPRLCSTSANCLLACVSTRLTLDQRVYVEVWVCSAGQSRAVLFATPGLSLHAYWRRQQRPSRCLWGAQVPHSLFPLFTVRVSPPWLSPGSLTAVLRLKQLSSADSSCGKIKRPHHGLFSKAIWCRCSLTDWNQDRQRLKGSRGLLMPCMRWFSGSRHKLLRRLQKWMWRWLLEVCFKGCLE